MQNKGFIKVFAVLLALICVFYMSFTFVTRPYYTKADEFAKSRLEEQGLDPNDNDREFSKLVSYYLNDSLANKKVWGFPESWTWLPKIFQGGYTLKEAREREINLGLDLKGGMNVVMAISVPDVLKALSDNNPDENFNKALEQAAGRQRTSQKDFITLFAEEFKNLDENARLSAIFATRAKESKITSNSSDADVIKVLREELDGALSNSFNVLRLRIDRFGVAQPNIQQLGSSGQILIELPGVKEPERVRKLLQGSANLEFWETYKLNEIYRQIMDVNNVIRDLEAAKRSKTEDATASEEVTQVTANDSLQVTSKADSLLAQHGVGEQQSKDLLSDRAEWEKQYPLFAVLRIDQSEYGLNSPIVGMSLAKDTAAVNRYLNLPQVKSILPRNLMLRWTLKPEKPKVEDTKVSEFYQLIALKITKNDRTAALGGDVVTDARADFGGQGRGGRQDSRVSVSMSMNAEGAKEWARITRENINRSIAIVLDDYVYSFPNVQVEITGGQSSISGNFTPEEGTDLANVLKSGKMAAPARIVQEDVIGPSLGQEAINKGIISFIIALIVLMAYLYVVYGFVPGTIANSALIVNLFFTMGILAAFGAVLTLAGIAGIVLALAIAVDANVLIHERIKEELLNGKNIKRAVEDGYKRAFSAIFDSNVSSILTGVILFYFGTGPIRGFATTLIIGILVSFFTAVFLTHLVYEYLLGKGKLQNLTFTTKVSKNFLVKPAYKFIEHRKLYYSIMAGILVISGVFLAFRGLNQGIDFTGGRNYVVRFDEPVSTVHVQEMLVEEFGEGSGIAVITIGGSNQVRISTNFGIHDPAENIDSLIESKLYTALKPLLKEGVDRETFSTVNKQSSTKVGPSVADDIKKGAVWAIIFSVIALGIYILIRFRDISFSVATIVTLIADAIFILGCYAIFWGILPFSMEIDQTFIGAILTALGYSINDKVVVFDRIREYTHLYPKREKMRLFDESLNTTLNRTINTSLSTLLVLIVIFSMAGDTIRSFSFAMILGVLGALTSLFIAAPIAYEIQSRKQKRKGGDIEK